MSRCLICQGETSGRNITYTQWFEGELVAVQNVPAEVCDRCGEQYFSPETVNRIQEVIYSRCPSGTLTVSLFDLASIGKGES